HTLARLLPLAKVRVITGSVIEALCMIWILLRRQARNLEPALIILRVLLILVIQTVLVQLLRNEFVGWLTERLSFQPLELRRALAGIRDHLLHRRPFILETAAPLILDG